METDLKDKLSMFRFAIDKSVEELASICSEHNVPEHVMERAVIGLMLVSKSIDEEVMKMIVGKGLDDLLKEFDMDNLKPEDFGVPSTETETETRQQKDHKDVTDFDGNNGYI